MYVDENNEVHEKTDLAKLIIDEVQKLKGMKKYVVQENIIHEHYKRCLFNGQKHYETMETFRSYNQNISTISQNKLALSRYEDKRYILDDGIETFVHGHYDSTEFVYIVYFTALYCRRHIRTENKLFPP